MEVCVTIASGFAGNGPRTCFWFLSDPVHLRGVGSSRGHAIKTPTVADLKLSTFNQTFPQLLNFPLLCHVLLCLLATDVSISLLNKLFTVFFARKKHLCMYMYTHWGSVKPLAPQSGVRMERPSSRGEAARPQLTCRAPRRGASGEGSSHLQLVCGALRLIWQNSHLKEPS